MSTIKKLRKGVMKNRLLAVLLLAVVVGLLGYGFMSTIQPVILGLSTCDEMCPPTVKSCSGPFCVEYPVDYCQCPSACDFEHVDVGETCTSTGCIVTNDCAEKYCTHDNKIVTCYDNCGNPDHDYDFCDVPDEICINGACIPAVCEVTDECDTMKCYGNAIYCYDNCGIRKAQVEQCDVDCVGGVCVDKKCEVVDHCVAKKCSGGDLWCRNNCDERDMLYRRCNLGCDEDSNRCNELWDFLFEKWNQIDIWLWIVLISVISLLIYWIFLDKTKSKRK